METDKKEEKNKYNNLILAERLEDLRKNNKYSLEQLSANIFSETTIYISPKTLSNYENNEFETKPNIEYLITIANFYDVSLYYLLGFQDCKDVTNEAISKKTGLMEEAIKGLEQLKRFLDNPVDDWNNERIDVRYADIVSHIIGNADLWITLINETSRLIFLYSNEDYQVRFERLLNEDDCCNTSPIAITPDDISQIVISKYIMGIFNKYIDTKLKSLDVERISYEEKRIREVCKLKEHQILKNQKKT